MDQGLIPRRYAKALYKFALEKGDAGRVYSLMKTLAASFVAEPTLQQVMENPYVTAADKSRLLTTACGASETDTVVADYFKLLAENHRFEMARAIADAYCLLYRQANNIYRVSVTSAAPLQPDEEKRLKDFVTAQLNGGSMEYHSAVDEQLIGGFVISIDNELLDASLSNELNQLRLKLLSK